MNRMVPIAILKHLFPDIGKIKVLVSILQTKNVPEIDNGKMHPKKFPYRVCFYIQRVNTRVQNESGDYYTEYIQINTVVWNNNKKSLKNGILLDFNPSAKTLPNYQVNIDLHRRNALDQFLNYFRQFYPIDTITVITDTYTPYIIYDASTFYKKLFRGRTLPSLIKKVPFIESKKNIDDSCAICLEPLDEGNPCKLDRCSHMFHCECIDRLPKIQDTYIRCPICRKVSGVSQKVKVVAFGSTKKKISLRSINKDILYLSK